MANGRKRGNSRAKTVEPISVWRALNQPIVEVSEGFARGIFLMSAVIMLAVWLAPYWGQASTQYTVHSTQLERVAGEQIVADIVATPEWYYVAFAIPGDVASAFAQAADDVLDISEPVQALGDFYEPGAEAVLGAWLDLMADPY